MTIDDDVKQIMDLWHSIEEDTKWELANIWLDKEKGKLEFIEAKVEELEAKVINLLKIIKDSKGNIAEMHQHKRHLLRLLHHVKPTKKWQREIQEELDEIASEVKIYKEKARAIIKTRMEARRHAIAQTADQTRTQVIHQIDLEELRLSRYKTGKKLDNGLWVVPTQNPRGYYVFAFDNDEGTTDEVVFKCYPNLPHEALGQPFGFAFSYCKIKKLAWTSKELGENRSRDILFDDKLIPGEVLITEAFQHWKQDEEEKQHRLKEMIPSPKSMKQLIETTDRRTWIKIRVGDMFAIPFPAAQNPKSYYLIPNPDTEHILRVDILSKFYPDMRSEDRRNQYIIEKSAWISSDVLQRAKFDFYRIEATWEAEGEIGKVKKIR